MGFWKKLFGVKQVEVITSESFYDFEEKDDFDLPDIDSNGNVSGSASLLELHEKLSLKHESRFEQKEPEEVIVEEEEPTVGLPRFRNENTSPFGSDYFMSNNDIDKSLTEDLDLY